MTDPEPVATISRDGATPSPPRADAPIDPADLPVGELGERCGIQLIECTPERLTATMPVLGNRQPFGLLHGGASAVLAETIGSIHANVLAGQGRIAVGIELTCTHHRSATDGIVTAISTPLHVGRQICTFHITIRDELDRRVCTARLTCMTRSAERPAPAAVADRDGIAR